MKESQWIRWAMIVAVIFFLGSPNSVIARGYDYSSDVRVEVISDERGPLTKFDAGFDNRHATRNYVIARDNERYSIQISNMNSSRVGVVIAVDGRNIISGRKSHLKPNERMYILGPYETREYEGWRTGRNRVNRFFFTGMDDSYAAAWGDYTAMGVIAVAVFEERHRKIYKPRQKPKLGPFGKPRANARKQNPGTGFGETEWSPSRTVQFSPEQKAVAKEFIKYEWRTTLCKRGILSCRERKGRHDRNRFWPEHREQYGFAPFPPFWPFSR